MIRVTSGLRRLGRAWPYGLIVLGFGADRLAKGWAATFLAEHGPTQLNGLLTVRETYNRGVAFGLLPGIGPAVGWFSLLVVLAMLIYLARLPRRQWLGRSGLALIIGGAAGNLVDRVVAGRVLDFMETPLRPGIFNVADVLINAGMILLLLGFYFQGERQAEKAATAPGEPPEPGLGRQLLEQGEEQ